MKGYTLLRRAIKKPRASIQVTIDIDGVPKSRIEYCPSIDRYCRVPTGIS